MGDCIPSTSNWLSVQNRGCLHFIRCYSSLDSATGTSCYRQPQGGDSPVVLIYDRVRCFNREHDSQPLRNSRSPIRCVCRAEPDRWPPPQADAYSAAIVRIRPSTAILLPLGTSARSVSSGCMPHLSRIVGC